MKKSCKTGGCLLTNSDQETISSVGVIHHRRCKIGLGPSAARPLISSRRTRVVWAVLLGLFASWRKLAMRPRRASGESVRIQSVVVIAVGPSRRMCSHGVRMASLTRRWSLRVRLRRHVREVVSHRSPILLAFMASRAPPRSLE